jgi:hypothetical protein
MTVIPNLALEFVGPELKLKNENKSGNENAKQIPKAINHFHSFLKIMTTAATKNRSSMGQKNRPKTLKNMNTLGVKCAEI